MDTIRKKQGIILKWADASSGLGLITIVSSAIVFKEYYKNECRFLSSLQKQLIFPKQLGIPSDSIQTNSFLMLNDLAKYIKKISMNDLTSTAAACLQQTLRMLNLNDVYHEYLAQSKANDVLMNFTQNIPQKFFNKEWKLEFCQNILTMNLLDGEYNAKLKEFTEQFQLRRRQILDRHSSVMDLQYKQFTSARQTAKERLPTAVANYEKTLYALDVLQQYSHIAIPTVTTIKEHEAARINALKMLRSLISKHCKMKTRDTLLTVIMSIPKNSIGAEILETGRVFHQLHKRVKKHIPKAIKRCEQMLLFKAVSCLTSPPMATGSQLLVWRTLMLGCGLSKTVEGFIAYVGLEDNPEISRAAERLVPASSRLFVQPLVPIEVSYSGPMPTCVSLSLDGILCISNNATEQLHIHNMMTGVSRVLDTGNNAFGCVYNGRLFVCWSSESVMRYAPIEAVMRGEMDVRHFMQFALPGRYTSAPFLDRAAMGSVAFSDSNEQGRHLVVHLRKLSSKAVSMSHSLGELCGFTGIDIPDALWAAVESEQAHKTFVIRKDNSVEPITTVASDTPIIIPSRRMPSNLTRALIVCGNGDFIYRDSVVPHKSLEISPMFRPLVRLYQDMFLCYDSDAREWSVARVHVP
eukprot:gnl/Chilomastix_cuspidata/1859.p1 GENE.gnl/Chilomastix_cuspidata/1859~~gnl/Chilomastix_cuspidata/1859.p1  ORF type:complete len:635 (+),score=125.44 gnl/Chilomastix_cuspidata/1859:98-2002(+)